jgi:hypothetical protein
MTEVFSTPQLRASQEFSGFVLHSLSHTALIYLAGEAMADAFTMMKSV